MRTCKSICGLNLALLFVLLYAIVPFALHVVDAQNTARAIQPQAYFTEPALSPDRKEIAFVSGGDIWTVPATGGVAALLVSQRNGIPARDSRFPVRRRRNKRMPGIAARGVRFAE